LEAEMKKHNALKRALKRKLKLLSEARIIPKKEDFKDIPPALDDLLHANGKSNNFEELMKLARRGIKLGMSLSGKNTSDFDQKELRIGSPRFFSLLPDENSDNTINLLSPSLLNMHDKGNDIENSVSVPKLLESLRSSKLKDHEDLMNLIFEVSGVSEHLKKAKEKLQEENLKNAKGIDGQPLYFTKENVTEMFGDFEKRKIETFEKLHKTFTNEQKGELNDTGMTTLTREQLFLIYGKDSPYQDLMTLHRLTNIVNDDHLQKLIMDDIHKLANSKKVIVLSPAVMRPSFNRTSKLTPVILSPGILNPSVLSPSILGPVILSPGLFNPSFLCPRLLGPVILSPGGFSPLVLSPVALSPVVLSPGVFGPVVLSPTALSPGALNAGFGSPVVLSPFILNPGLLNFSAMSPLILSPFAFSPSILSKTFFSALILSPMAFSPSIGSHSQNVSVILSPNLFS
uniref:PABC domain-containing protein n=1 Tax=Dracunculus medinensis TaxID=318479 RepID=A0A0N4U3B2_DRAME